MNGRSRGILHAVVQRRDANPEKYWNGNTRGRIFAAGGEWPIIIIFFRDTLWTRAVHENLFTRAVNFHGNSKRAASGQRTDSQYVGRYAVNYVRAKSCNCLTTGSRPHGAVEENRAARAMSLGATCRALLRGGGGGELDWDDKRSRVEKVILGCESSRSSDERIKTQTVLWPAWRHQWSIQIELLR